MATLNDLIATENDLKRADAEIARLTAERDRLLVVVEDARHYAAVCPVPDELVGPARIEMLERRQRIVGAGHDEQPTREK